MVNASEQMQRMIDDIPAFYLIGHNEQYALAAPELAIKRVAQASQSD